MRRTLWDIFLIISVFIFPWWFIMLLGCIGLIIFSNFFEIFILGIIIDSLYNAPIPRFHGVEFVVTIFAVILFILVEIVKRRVRFTQI